MTQAGWAHLASFTKQSLGALTGASNSVHADAAADGRSSPFHRLQLDMRIDDTLESLARANCTDHLARELIVLLSDRVERLAMQYQQCYSSTCDDIATTFKANDQECLFQTYTTTLAARLRREFISAKLSLTNALLSEVHAARARLLPSQHSPSAPADPSTSSSVAPGFTPATLALLESAFDLTNHITRAEKAELARVTGLSERQLATWFANRRQRRARRSSSVSSATRAAPYPTSTAHAPSLNRSASLTRPQHRRAQSSGEAPQDRANVRTVSSSSFESGSSSADVITYEGSPSSDSASGAEAGRGAQYSAEGDISFETGLQDIDMDVDWCSAYPAEFVATTADYALALDVASHEIDFNELLSGYSASLSSYTDLNVTLTAENPFLSPDAALPASFTPSPSCSPQPLFPASPQSHPTSSAAQAWAFDGSSLAGSAMSDIFSPPLPDTLLTGEQAPAHLKGLDLDSNPLDASFWEGILSEAELRGGVLEMGITLGLRQ